MGAFGGTGTGLANWLRKITLHKGRKTPPVKVVNPLATQPKLFQVLTYASSELLRKKLGLPLATTAGGRVATAPSVGGGRAPVNPAGGGRGRGRSPW